MRPKYDKAKDPRHDPDRPRFAKGGIISGSKGRYGDEIPAFLEAACHYYAHMLRSGKLVFDSKGRRVR